MEILIYENGPFMVNSYLVYNDDSKNGIIIDPGSEMNFLAEKIDEEKIDVEAIVCTHGHIDHVSGAKFLQDKYKIPLYLNEQEKELVGAIPIQARMFGISDPGIPSIDENLPTSGKIEIAGIEFILLHTPGHSPGSISRYTEDIVFLLPAPGFRLRRC